MTVPFWEIGFLHENIVTRKIVSYLSLKLQDEPDPNIRQAKATKILQDADDALGVAIESLQNRLTYEPAQLMGVEMSPSLLMTIGAVGASIMWQIVSQLFATFT